MIYAITANTGLPTTTRQRSVDMARRLNPITITCPCGNTFETFATLPPKLCPACTEEHEKEWRRQRAIKRGKRPYRRRTQDNNACTGCEYWRALSSVKPDKTLFACHYFLDAKKRRPCTAGAGCTVRSEKKHKRVRNEIAFGRAVEA